MRKILHILLVAFVVSSCGLERTSYDDPTVQKLLVAAQTFDREKYGFAPVKPSDQFALQMYGSGSYDAMLHINRSFSDSTLFEERKIIRTIAFKKESNSYRWIGEQAKYIGPNKYKDMDKMRHEFITLTYETVKRPGFPINEIDIIYTGDDNRLHARPGLDDIRPILKEWGYDVE